MSTANPMMRGVVTDFSKAKGFGYLRCEDNDEYCFFAGDIQNGVPPFKAGDRVTFEIQKGRGTKAVNIKIRNS